MPANGVSRDRLNQPHQLTNTATWADVLMRPYSGSEKVDRTDIAVQVWRCTGPATDASRNVTAAGQLEYDNNTYQITKVEPFADFDGQVSHVQITCQRQLL